MHNKWSVYTHYSESLIIKVIQAHTSIDTGGLTTTGLGGPTPNFFSSVCSLVIWSSIDKSLLILI